MNPYICLLFLATILTSSCEARSPQTQNPNTSAPQSASRSAEELTLIEKDPHLQAIWSGVDKKELKKRIEGMALGEEDQIAVKISKESEILAIHPTQFTLAGEASQILSAAGTMMMVPGYFMLGTRAVGSGAVIFLSGASMLFLGSQ